MDLLRELKRSGSREYTIVDVDRVERRTLPLAVRGVPMALLPDGRALSGDALFATVFKPDFAEPSGLGGEGFGAFLEAVPDVAEENPKEFLDQYFARVETPAEDAPGEQQVSLDELQAARNQDLQAIGAG